MKNQIENVKSEIEKVATSAGRNPGEIKLLAVTKTHSIEVIKEALTNGITCIAESKVQEAEQKIPHLVGLYSEFHFIGHLQSNKIKKLLSLQPKLIHSIDKYDTAKKINDILNTTQDILIEVNTSDEQSKHGCPVEHLHSLIKQIDELPNLRIKGLMTIGALTEDTETIRACFRLLRSLFEDVKAMPLSPRTTMQYLSMGMSDDFRIAIEEGSHIVRIGTGLFGSRNYEL